MTKKIENIKELETLKEKYEKEYKNYKHIILVCGGTGCLSCSANEIYEEFQTKLKEKEIEDTKVIKVGCIGLCAMGPIVLVDDENYPLFKKMYVEKILDENILNLKKADLLKPEIKTRWDNFFKNQKKDILNNCGNIDPKSIQDYIRKGGYKTLNKAFHMKSEEIIKYLKDSNLRGRGGAMFPTYKKWKAVSNEQSEEKYIICNADEGDPGVYMDRYLLEGDPHKIIEAMIIAAHTLHVNKGYIYLRAEYTLAIEHIEKAIKDAESFGLLGNNILGSSLNFTIETVYGGGNFVAGEESAIIDLFNNARGRPIPNCKPYKCGINGKPTLINNVETFANIPKIIEISPNEYAKDGASASQGTKIFALTGNIQNSGLIEVPFGVTIRELVEKMGAGSDSRKIKAVVIGGPSGGLVTEEDLDMPLLIDECKAYGSMLGSGGVIVLDESNCILQYLIDAFDFASEQACGKCSPCTLGNKAIYEALIKISKGKGTLKELDDIENIAKAMTLTSICGHGKSTPLPLFSALRHYRKEIEAHIGEHATCPAKSCKDLIHYEINKETCVGCTACFRKCPADAIISEKKTPHIIQVDKCIRCGNCYKACKYESVLII